MELIRISDRKLKIMLTPSDMRHFELNVDTFGDDNTQMHRSFQLLLAEVKRQTGFEADDRQISVQYFPSREGGCEMFISRLSATAETLSEEKNAFSTGRALQVRPSGRRQGSFHKESAYSFESMENLLAVCHRLSDIGYIGSSSAYRDRTNRYYLSLGFLASSPFSVPQELGFIVEYGKIENPTSLKLYILEHGDPICPDNAVHQLGSLH